MILHYLWVREYQGRLINQSVNLGAELHFDYRSDPKELHIKRMTELPVDFFAGAIPRNQAKVANVTCIAGQNGMGKSSILEVLQHLIGRTSDSWQLSDNFILIFKTNLTPFTFDSPAHYKVFTNIKPSPSEVFHGDLNATTTICSYLSFFDHYNLDYKCVYYSNNFDFRESRYDTNLFDISTNQLLRNSQFAPGDVDREGHYSEGYMDRRKLPAPPKIGDGDLDSSGDFTLQYLRKIKYPLAPRIQTVAFELDELQRNIICLSATLPVVFDTRCPKANRS
jgi:hypothetical protein